MSPYQDHAVIQSHISRWQASGLTQAAYCQEHGIKPHIFSYYKKKFSEKAAPSKRSSQLIPVKFVGEGMQVGLNPSPSSSSDVVRLSHANGFSLEINAHTDLALLKPLLELLGSVT
jgi:hypothetical protein